MRAPIARAQRNNIIYFLAGDICISISTLLAFLKYSYVGNIFLRCKLQHDPSGKILPEYLAISYPTVYVSAQTDIVKVSAITKAIAKLMIFLILFLPPINPFPSPIKKENLFCPGTKSAVLCACFLHFVSSIIL